MRSLLRKIQLKLPRWLIHGNMIRPNTRTRDNWETSVRNSQRLKCSIRFWNSKLNSAQIKLYHKSMNCKYSDYKSYAFVSLELRWDNKCHHQKNQHKKRNKQIKKLSLNQKSLLGQILQTVKRHRVMLFGWLSLLKGPHGIHLKLCSLLSITMRW